MRTRTALGFWAALAVTWSAGAVIYVYPDVKEEIEEKRYLHRVEKLHTPVLPIECAGARGIENRDFIREDRNPGRCWITVPAFNDLYPELAQATDIAATLRSRARNELPSENWEGTPVRAVLEAALVVFTPPLALLLALLACRSRERPEVITAFLGPPASTPMRADPSPGGQVVKNGTVTVKTSSNTSTKL